MWLELSSGINKYWGPGGRGGCWVGGKRGLLSGWGPGPAREAVSDTGGRAVPCRWTRLPISSGFSPGHALRVARCPDPTAVRLRGSDLRESSGSPGRPGPPRTFRTEGNACHLVVFFWSCTSAPRPTRGQIHTWMLPWLPCGRGTHVLRGFVALLGG